jgi:hypothetical protein
LPRSSFPRDGLKLGVNGLIFVFQEGELIAAVHHDSSVAFHFDNE